MEQNDVKISEAHRRKQRPPSSHLCDPTCAYGWWSHTLFLKLCLFVDFHLLAVKPLSIPLGLCVCHICSSWSNTIGVLPYFHLFQLISLGFDCFFENSGSKRGRIIDATMISQYEDFCSSIHSFNKNLFHACLCYRHCIGLSLTPTGAQLTLVELVFYWQILCISGSGSFSSL